MLFVVEDEKWQGQVRGEGEKWTIRGAFAALKENLRFSESFYGFSSLYDTTKKHPERGAFSLVDD